MRFIIALIAAVAALSAGPAFAAGYNDFTGRWQNADRNTRDLTRLRISFDGDNLDVLRRHVKDESVDLIYLDPQFNSAQNYNVLFEERNGEATVV